MELNEETTVTITEAEDRLDAAAAARNLAAFVAAAADLIDLSLEGC